MYNVHFIFIDPFIDYNPSSVQYQFIEQDLRNASTNPNIDWTFVVETTPIYTSLLNILAILQLEIFIILSLINMVLIWYLLVTITIIKEHFH